MTVLDEIEARYKSWASDPTLAHDAQILKDMKFLIVHLRIAQSVITQADIIAIQKRAEEGSW